MASLVVPSAVEQWQLACDDDLAATSRITRRLGIGLRSAPPELLGVNLLATPPDRCEAGQLPGSGDLLERMLADPDPLAVRMTGFWVHHIGHVAGDVEHLRRCGTRKLADVASSVDHVAFVRCLYRYFAGSEPSAAIEATLIDLVSSGQHDIRTLIGLIASDRAVPTKARTRPRFDFEWLLGAAWALGIDDFEEAHLVPDHLWGRGRSPALAAIEIARRAAVLSWRLPERTRVEVPPEPAAVLARCGIFDPSWSTWTQLSEANRRFAGRDDHLQLLFALALTCREFAWL